MQDQNPSRDNETGTGQAELARIRGLLSGWSVVHIRVRSTSEGEIDVPFAGSLIRGAFGASLRRLLCAGKSPSCPNCILEPHCLFAELYEDPRPSGERSNRGRRPRPFAIVPPPRIAPGPLEFELKLFGPPPAALGYLVCSLVDMGSAGIGRDLVPIPVDRIESIVPGRPPATLYDRRKGLFPDRVAPFHPDVLLDRPETAARGDRLRVRLRTPVRMKDAGKLESSLPFDRLMRAALRRLADLGETFGQEWPRSWPELMASAGRASILREDTRWFDWGRFSFRQDRAMRLGGVVGEMEYGGMTPEAAGVLRAASFFHIGKNATFGLGSLDIEELP